MSTLVYNGTPIHDRDDKLNLTDMWRASGSDQSKRPYEWLRSQQSREFIGHLQEAGNSRLLEREPGNPRAGAGGAMWAHWKIGLAYAEYLSPEFHDWCLTVVRAYMEGKLVPAPSMDNGLAVLVQTMERTLAPVTESVRLLSGLQVEHRARLDTIDTKVDTIETKVDSMGQTIATIQASVECFVKRRNLSEETKTLHRTIISRLGGRCPACGLVELFDGDGKFIGQWDHFYARNRAKPHETWPICVECNRRRATAQSWNHDMSTAFNAYQTKLDCMRDPLLHWGRVR